MRVTVEYSGHPDEVKDAFIEKLFSRYGGRATGSGYDFSTDKRDIGGQLPQKRYKQFEKAILRRFKKARVERESIE